MIVALVAVAASNGLPFLPMETARARADRAAQTAASTFKDPPRTRILSCIRRSRRTVDCKALYSFSAGSCTQVVRVQYSTLYSTRIVTSLSRTVCSKPK